MNTLQHTHTSTWKSIQTDRHASTQRMCGNFLEHSDHPLIWDLAHFHPGRCACHEVSCLARAQLRWVFATGDCESGWRLHEIGTFAGT